MVKYIFIGLSLILAIATAYFFYLLGPVSEFGDEKNFYISPGTGINEIADALEEQTLIRSSRIFKFYSFLTGSAHILKPGNYSLAVNLGIPEILDRLVLGPPDVELLIAEGRSLRDIDSHLSSLGLIEAGSLANLLVGELADEFVFLQGITNLEGFLFPDTYRISPGSSPETIVKKFLSNFREKAVLAFGATNLENQSDWYQDLIIASLVEKEVPPGRDRNLVAGILKKRLSLGMPLQVDATVVYTKCAGRYLDCPALTKGDFKLPSDYNTYFKKGLPPTPIANAGLDAIAAALNPEESAYLYYLSDPDTKKTIFSKTFEEHDLNRSRYLVR